MTKELKQKAEDFIESHKINKYMFNIPLVDLLTLFATEATKELQEKNKHYYVHTCGRDFVIDEINADVTFSGTKKECEQFVLITEAKELIKRVVEWSDADHPEDYFEWIVKDLKQFLKED